MRSSFGLLLVVLALGCGGVSAVEADASGAAGGGAGTGAGQAGVTGTAGTSSAAGSSGAGTTGAAGTGSAGGGAGVTGAAGAAAGSTGTAGTAGTGAAGTGAAVAMCVHNAGPIVVTGLCAGKATCSKSCECSGGYNSSGQACRTGNAQLDVQLPCAAPAEYIGDQPGAAAHNPKYMTGFCNRAGTLCTGATTMLCVSDCAECP